jgi:hypothetical protein
VRTHVASIEISSTVADVAAFVADADKLPTGRVQPDRLLFAEHVQRIERLQDAAAVFRSHPEQRAPDRVVAAVMSALRG